MLSLTSPLKIAASSPTCHRRRPELYASAGTKQFLAPKPGSPEPKLSSSSDLYCSYQNTAPLVIAGSVNVIESPSWTPFSACVSPSNGRKNPRPCDLDATVTCSPVCGVCTAFLPPSSPVKLAKKTFTCPSDVRAIEVATCCPAFTRTASPPSRALNKPCSASGDVCSKFFSSSAL